MTITLITFDLDNTLWDVEPALHRAEAAQRQWLQTHHPKALTLFDETQLLAFKKAVWQRNPAIIHDVTKIRRQFLLELLREAGCSEAEANRGADQAFAAFLAARQQVDLYPEAIPVLAELSQRFTLGALTNGNADIYKTPAGQYFEFAFLAEDVGAAKPHPAMFEAALATSGATASQAIHVGDDPVHDVQGAQSLGLFTVWMNSRGKTWDNGAPADAEINTLDQLPDKIAAIVSATGSHQNTV